MSGESSALPPVPLMPLLARDPQQLGPFRLLGRLGSGGMGTAFLAHGPTGWVVVKEAHAGTAGDPVTRARLSREVDAMRRTQGPRTAAVIDADLDAEVPWVAMEFLPGETLAQTVEKSGPLPPQQVTTLASELAEALQQIHSAGVQHRDLKPSNVMLTPTGARLIDLGIADVDEGTQLTRTGSVLGSTGWMAPEQVRGDPTSAATDVHAWALCVLYAATGKAPFGSDTSAAAMYRVLEAAPEVPDFIPERTRGLVIRALDKNPTLRPTLDEILGTEERPTIHGTNEARPASDVYALQSQLRTHAPEGPTIDVAEGVQRSQSARRPSLVVATLALLVVVGALAAVAAFAWALRSESPSSAALSPGRPSSSPSPSIGTAATTAATPPITSAKITNSSFPLAAEIRSCGGEYGGTFTLNFNNPSDEATGVIVSAHSTTGVVFGWLRTIEPGESVESFDPDQSDMATEDFPTSSIITNCDPSEFGVQLNP